MAGESDGGAGPSEPHEAIVGGSAYHWKLAPDDAGPDPVWKWVFLSSAASVVLLALGAGVYSAMSGNGTALFEQALRSEGAEPISGAAGGALAMAVVLGLLVGLVSGYLVYQTAQSFRGKLITTGIWTSVALFGLVAVVSLVLGQFVVGVLVLIPAGILAAFPFCCPSRIRFAEAFVECALQVVQDFPGLLGTGFGAVGVQIGFVTVWGIAFLSVASFASGPAPNEGAVVAVSIANFLLLLILFWVTATISGVVAVTTARVTALWWTAGSVDDAAVARAAELGAAGNADDAAEFAPASAGAADGGGARSFGGTPSGSAGALDSTWKTAGEPVLRARQWASWAALGPISFASLILAFVQCLRFVAESAGSEDGNNESMLAACFRCLVICFLRCIEDLIKYFNSYLFAVLGVARGTTKALSLWEGTEVVMAITNMHTASSAIINDTLVDTGLNLLSLIALLGAGLFGAVVGALLSLLAPAGKAQVVVLVSCIVVSAAIGFIVAQTLVSILAGSVKALFVLWAAQQAAIGGAGATAVAPAPGSGKDGTAGIELVRTPASLQRADVSSRLQAAWGDRVKELSSA